MHAHVGVGRGVCAHVWCVCPCAVCGDVYVPVCGVCVHVGGVCTCVQGVCARVYGGVFAGGRVWASVGLCVFPCGGVPVSLYVCARLCMCACTRVPVRVCPRSFPCTSTHHQQPQRSGPTASDPPTGTKPPTFSGTQAPRRGGSAHLLLQLVLVALPGQLVLILGPLGEKRAARTHLSRELHSGPTRPGTGTPTRHQPHTNMGGRGPPVRLSSEGLCRS